MSDWEFFNSIERTARKVHRCAECAGEIKAGERYVYCSGKVEGCLDHYRLCLICELITTEANIAIYEEGFPIGMTRQDLREEHGIEDPEAWARERRAERFAKRADREAQTDAAVDAFLTEVRAELIRARTKFPGDRIMTIALAEEFGELCKAVLDEPAAHVRKEAVQTAVMAARVVLDGDGSVNDWRAAKGLDPLSNAREPQA